MAISQRRVVYLEHHPPKFYTNDDTDREVDAAGIQILDDSLLTDEDVHRPPAPCWKKKAAE